MVTALVGTIVLSVVSENRANREADVAATLAEAQRLAARPGELMASAHRAFAVHRFADAQQALRAVIDSFPDDARSDTARSLLPVVDSGVAELALRERREAEQTKSRLRLAFRGLRSRYDEVREITWYYDRRSPPTVGSRSAIYPYMGMGKTGSPWLRMILQYEGSSWVFIDEIIVKTDDRTFTISPRIGEVESGNYTDVWEWYDALVGPTERAILDAVAESSRTIVRFQGKRYSDHVVTASEKAAIRNLLEIYDGLQRLGRAELTGE